MTTTHLWFRSGAYSLLGHIDIPEAPRGTAGVLVVPPFGWEDVCSYRPLRFLAKTLAESGIPVMRFDLPGTGDSSGSALDSGLFEAWIQSVDDAATKLRAVTGVKDVTVVGIRLGALLALTAAARGSNLQDLILWGATASGRAMLRELRAFSNMSRVWQRQRCRPSPYTGGRNWRLPDHSRNSARSGKSCLVAPSRYAGPPGTFVIAR